MQQSAIITHNIVFHEKQGLVLNGLALEKSVRRLSAILLVSSGDVFLWDRPQIQDWVQNGNDPILYEAYRSILPPRYSATGSSQYSDHCDRNTPMQWHIDFVTYRSGILPGGELYRSVGHWNPAYEWELFQVYSGQMLMVCADQEPDGTWMVEIVACEAGDSVALKPGLWHITYPLVDYTSVINTYSSPIFAPSSAIGSPTQKYELHSHNQPELAVISRDGEIQAVWSDGTLKQRAPFRSPDGIAFLGGKNEHRWLGQWFSFTSQSDFERDLAMLYSKELKLC